LHSYEAKPYFPKGGIHFGSLELAHMGTDFGTTWIAAGVQVQIGR